MLEIQQKIIDTLTTFRVDVTPGDITRGPTITRYEVYPARGVRVNTFDQYAKDIALATKAESVNIVAPIPGKDTVGIEIVNRKKVAVPLRELLQDPAFCSPKKKIPLALGKDVSQRAHSTAWRPPGRSRALPSPGLSELPGFSWMLA